jgi:hypothetical protein
MKRRSSVAAVSKTAPKISIAQAYLQLQHLRQLVQEAERSLAPHDVKSHQPVPELTHGDLGF